ncbi:MAG: META domain-containing protein [Flavobacteriaceae bacterium]|nr:META domain-containing protein [Flavobacteriaceae bacterium]
MRIVQLIYGLILIMFTACGSLGPTAETHVSSLKGIWTLQYEKNSQLGLSNEPVTLSFDQNSPSEIGGFSGCNLYGGNYTYSGDGMIKFSEIFSTKRACPDLDIENKFFELMNSVNRFEVKGNDLYLYKDKLLLMHFEK